MESTDQDVIFHPKIKEEIECELCFEKFDIFENEPRIIPCCKRIYCKNCLVRLFKKFPSTNARCPNCRQDTLEEKKLNEFPVKENYFIYRCPNCAASTNNLFTRKIKGIYIYYCKICRPFDSNDTFGEYEVKDFFESYLNKFLLNSHPQANKELNEKKKEELYCTLYLKFQEEIEKQKDFVLSNFSKKLKAYLDLNFDKFEFKAKKSKVVEIFKNDNDIKKAIDTFNSTDTFDLNLDYFSKLATKIENLYEQIKEQVNFTSEISDQFDDYKIKISHPHLASFTICNTKIVFPNSREETPWKNEKKKFLNNLNIELFSQHSNNNNLYLAIKKKQLLKNVSYQKLKTFKTENNQSSRSVKKSNFDEITKY